MNRRRGTQAQRRAQLTTLGIHSRQRFQVRLAHRRIDRAIQFLRFWALGNPYNQPHTHNDGVQDWRWAS